MLTVLVSAISNSQVFFAEKMCVGFANAKATHIFFSKNISVYAIFNDQSFNDTLTNDIVSFDQLGPEQQFYRVMFKGLMFKPNHLEVAIKVKLLDSKLVRISEISFLGY